ncbi:MAG TPA: tyrosine-type recombinase/integrase [Candidatus Acidoferrales bacterium]|nr:tyrosine-type recombinase/integrase [Candidatus Acidoferrales bacterium]HEV3481071.1 tyrosine-type recombinase/integrase [Candidatus Acidoferrales bacterium]
MELRKSLKLRDWQKAQDLIRQWEAEGQHTQKPQKTAVVPAWEDFLADAQARGLRDSTLRKYRLLKRQMDDFAGRSGLSFLADFDLQVLGRFRATWKDGPRSSAKKLERLRAFFRFAQKRKWIPENPTADLKAPKIPLCPTMPFDCDEIVRTLAAIEEYKRQAPSTARNNAQRLRALILLLRYSGLRISDVVSLSADRIKGNRLFLYTAKTGVPVNVILPDFVVEAIEATPRVSGARWFWSGVGKLDSVVRSWQTRLRRIFELAKVPKGHAHRFRDTFAVELLLSGVPIERVSVLLGHQSVRITERHYAPWVRARQEQLEADLQRAWSRDPLVLLETKGTKKVHENDVTVN